MTSLLAWKNIWRSKRRSFVVIGSILLGTWALIFIMGFYNSFNTAFIKNAVEHEYSHIQIHDPSYLVDPGLSNKLSKISSVERLLDDSGQLEGFSKRQKVQGMIASAKTNLGIQIYGIHIQMEARTTALDSQVISGKYFSEIRRNPILISSEIAEKLNVDVRSKVVLTFQDINQNITAASFRIAGIFDTKSPKIDKTVVYVRYDDLSRLTDTNTYQELAVLLKDPLMLPSMVQTLRSNTSDTVRTFREIAPEFNLLEQSSSITKQVLTVIIMLALLFGIINTMLMAVLERTRELGMLRSIGMHKKSVFIMIIQETCLMALIAGPIGLILGFLTIKWTSSYGIDLSRYSEAMDQFGLDPVFYPEVATATYFILMGVVMVTALLGAIYPAIKAININPLEAIRKL